MKGEGEGDSMVVLLHNNHAIVNAQDKYGQTPLHFAAMTGNIAAATELVEYCNADVEVEDNQQTTPLIMAATQGYVDIARLLLESASANLRQADSSRQTALHRAVKSGHLRMVNLLLHKGRDMKNYMSFLNARDTKRKTALYHACSNGHVLVAAVLLEEQADAEAETVTLATSLHAAASVGNVDIIGVLLERKVQLDEPDLYQRTPLMYAAAGNNNKAIQLLAQRGANLEHKDLNQSTALLLAAHGGHAAAVQMLLELGADVQATDKLNKTAVYISAEQGKVETVKVLLEVEESKKLLDVVDYNGSPPVHIAVAAGNMAVVELLLKAGASIHLKNEEQDTVLHLAARRGYTIGGHEGVIKVLLEVGADLSTTNSSSSTPLHLAAAQGYTKCCLLLLDSDAPKDLHNKSAMWETALRHVSQDLHGRRLTPFRMLIERLPGVAEVVLHRCIKKINRMTTNDNNDDIQDRVMNFEYLDDTYQVRAGGSQFDQVGRLKPRASPYTKHARVLKHNHPLMLMVQYRQSSLLAHPVCVNLIKHKWVSYGRFVYYGNLGLYLVFLLSFTAYVLAVRELNWVGVNVTRAGEDEVRDAVHCEEVDWDEWHGTSFLWVTKWLVLVMAALQMLKEFAQLC
ncbi:Transient receptor potential cation channel subfamily A member 1-like 3, partial [Homarus americanus]